MKQYGAEDGFLFLFGNINAFGDKSPESHIHQVHCTEAVLKAAVICAGINEAGKAQLLDVPETLKPGMLNEIEDKISRNAYETIDRIVDYLPLVRLVDHLLKFEIQKYELVPNVINGIYGVS